MLFKAIQAGNFIEPAKDFFADKKVQHDYLGRIYICCPHCNDKIILTAEDTLLTGKCRCGCSVKG